MYCIDCVFHEYLLENKNGYFKCLNFRHKVHRDGKICNHFRPKRVLNINVLSNKKQVCEHENCKCKKKCNDCQCE